MAIITDSERKEMEYIKAQEHNRLRREREASVDNGIVTNPEDMATIRREAEKKAQFAALSVLRENINHDMEDLQYLKAKAAPNKAEDIVALEIRIHRRELRLHKRLEDYKGMLATYVATYYGEDDEA